MQLDYHHTKRQSGPYKCTQPIQDVPAIDTAVSALLGLVSMA